MYSDSDDDSQVSQPHLLIKKTKQSTTATTWTSMTTTTTSTTTLEANLGEDVVDRERENLELISFSDTTDETTTVKEQQLVQQTTSKSPKPTNPTDKLLIKYSSNSSSESPSSSGNDRSTSKSGSDSVSLEDDETSLGELLVEASADQKRTSFINKSAQTSPTLLNKFVTFPIKNQTEQSIEWNEFKKYASINSLESSVHSPEIAPFQSKYLRNWHQQQRQYYNQKRSTESLDTLFDSKLNLSVFDHQQTKHQRPTTSKHLDDNEDVFASFRRRQYGIFNFDFDEELFYKIKKLFPQVTDEKIRTFMYKHHNQEHDVISAVINSLSPKRERRRLKHQSAMDKVLGNYIRMHREIDQLDEERKRLSAKDEKDDDHNYAKVEIKIKYLKLLYPKADLMDLFYLLHNCEMKANNVAKKLEELGYERKNLSESEESLVSSMQFEELMPELKLNFGEQQDRIQSLQEDYPLIDSYLVKLALKSTKFNVNEARKLLNTVDVNQYKNVKTYKYDYSIDDSKFIYKTDRGTQTNNVDYCDYGQTYRFERKSKQKCYDAINCKSTWTKEDNMQKIQITQIAKGPDPRNVNGPNCDRERIKSITPKGPDPRNRQVDHYKSYQIVGSNYRQNVKGSDSRNLINSKSLAIGPNLMNCRGSLKTRPKNSIFDDDDYDNNLIGTNDILKNYCTNLDDLLHKQNVFSSFNYLSNY